MDWLTWVRDNSSVVSAVAAAVIAIAALIIAAATVASLRIMRLEKRRERAERMPILALFEEIELHETTYSRALYVRNIGYGPAFNIVRKIGEMELVVGSLGPGDKTFALYRAGKDIPILDSPTFMAVFECDDIVDRHFEFTYENRRLSSPKRISKRKMPPSEARRS